MKRFFVFAFVILVSPILAVTTSHWSATNEADFKAGKFHNVVATSLGDLKLSRSVKSLLEEDPKIGAVYSLAEASDGTIYAGTGPQGVLLKVKDDKVSTVLELGDGINVTSLLANADGSLLIGTSGEKGQVLKLDHPGDKSGEKPKVFFEQKGVQYIWSMVKNSDGAIDLATGPNGELFELKDGTRTTLLKTDDNNFMCMVSDGKDLLYLGSDPNGLVYRVNRKTRESFVMYNAPETEISGLALDDKGDLFVGTSQTSDQPPGPEDTGAKDKSGRPEGGPGGVPIQSQPPANPAPPAVPNPNPDPIPKLDVAFADPADGPDAPGGDKPAPPPPGNEPNPPKAPDATTKTAPPGPNQQTPNAAIAGQPTAQGNAIYKIDPEGFVTEIFRSQVLIISMIEKDGVILAATGPDGLIYQVNPDADETSVIAKVDAKDVTCLFKTHDDRIILGTANVGGLASMGTGYASDGTFTSQVFDATQTSKFGRVQMHGHLPAGTKLTIATRSGNVKEPGDTAWSKWSDEQPAAEFVKTQSPAARFFQYRLSFATSADTATPVVDDVDVVYLMPNLPPQIKSIKVALGTVTPQPPAPPAEGQQSGAAPQPNGKTQTIVWDASDPNNDPLVFSLYYRQGENTPWILLKDKLKENTYEWDTRSVADGRYQVKVVASDSAANPVGQGKTANRVSDTVIVNNTAPTIGDIKSVVNGNSVTVTLRAVDRTGTIAAVDYAIDSSQDWQAATPSDTMFDSPDATATLTAEKLSPGAHEIALRVTDNRGNTAYQSVYVTIK